MFAGFDQRVASALVVATSLIACTIHTKSTAHAQIIPPFRPQPESVNLYDSEFAARVNDGSILLGTIQESQIAGKKINNWHHPDLHEINVQIKVERTVLGKAPKDSVVTIPSLWMNLNYWKSMLGENRPPAAGDLVFCQYLPSDISEEASLFDGADLGPARQEEVRRLDRVAKILRSVDAVQAAQSVLDGCLDPDPHFATWCLVVSDKRDRYAREPYTTAYGRIRSQISVSQNIEMCWNLLENPETHSLVYERADYRLASEKLSYAEQQRRHACHLQRIHDMLQIPPDSELARYYRVSELEYLLTSAYPKMPLKYRLEALEQLTEMVRSGSSVFRRVAVLKAAYLYEPDNETSRKRVFGFYRSCLPLRYERNGFESAYRVGLVKVMNKETKATQIISTSGLSLFQDVITWGDEKCSYRSVSSLEDYAQFCRREEIAWPELPQFLVSLIADSPHSKVKDRLKEAARRLDVPLGQILEAS